MSSNLNPARLHRRSFVCWLVIGAVLLAGQCWAHGPLDHSSRAFVGEAQVELVLTLGSDATQSFLAAAGFPETEIRQIQSLTSAQSPQPLPADLAAKLFEVLADGKSLAAQRVRVMGDGMESLFLLDFARPPGATLEFRARFFDGVENMKQGAFAAFDENQQSLGAARLSRGNNSIQIKLPAKAGVEPDKGFVAVAEAVSPEVRAGNESKTVVAPVATEGFVASTASRFWVGLAVGLAALLVLLGLGLWRHRGGKGVAPF